MSDTLIRPATEADAEVVVRLIHATFGDRPVLDPPATAMDESVDTVGPELAAHGGLLALRDGEPVGSLMFRPHGHLLGVRRVGVLKGARHHGVAFELARAAEEEAVARGFRGLVLEARAELPATVGFWLRQGYVEVSRVGPQLRMIRALPRTWTFATPDETQAWGESLGRAMGAGDVVIMTGELGAGKTTLTQGIAEGLGVRGPITSPTFVISRVHPPLADGPALVHVDAYRLGDTAELDDLDLDTDLDTAVTIVEWGRGIAESLSDERLELTLTAATDESRTITAVGVGKRWIDLVTQD
jgi:tRNA threonylcarbamoyladenosine biosynthesis protein TsaE